MPEKPPKEGIYVKGLFLVAARWNEEFGLMVDSAEHQLAAPMPIIHFRPVFQSAGERKARGMKVLTSSSSGNNRHLDTTVDTHGHRLKFMSMEQIDSMTQPKFSRSRKRQEPKIYHFSAPLYQTNTRHNEGRKSGDGSEDSKWIIDVSLPSHLSPAYWQRRGVCLVCNFKGSS